MKKLVAIIIFFCVAAGAQAQQTSAEPNARRLDSLEKVLYEGNYVRIPNADFENIIDSKISSTIRDEVKTWLWIIVSFFGALMTLLTFYLNRRLKDEVKESLDKETTSIAESIQKLADSQEALQKKILVVEEKVRNSMDIFWDEMIGLTIEKAKDIANLNTDMEKKINHFLEYEHVPVSASRLVQLIDALMRTYYYSKDKEKYKKMVTLIKQYEGKIDLEPQTYANAAIAHSNIYELYGNSHDRDNSLDNCDKSLNRSKEYGLPYAIKLEIYMIDYVKAFDDAQRNAALDNIRRVFKAVENNQSKVVPVDIVDRIEIDRNVAYLKPYYQRLEILFADDLNRVRERALDYLLANYSATIANEVDNKTLNSIFQYGLNTNSIIIDGDWDAVEVISAGVLNSQRMNTETLNINANTFASNDELGSGFIFFLTGNQPLAMNFYSKTTSNTFLRVPAIYQLTANSLEICYDPAAKTRPQSFVADATNRYTYVRLEHALISTATETPSLIKKLN